MEENPQATVKLVAEFLAKWTRAFSYLTGEEATGTF